MLDHHIEHIREVVGNEVVGGVEVGIPAFVVEAARQPGVRPFRQRVSLRIEALFLKSNAAHEGKGGGQRPPRHVRLHRDVQSVSAASI